MSHSGLCNSKVFTLNVGQAQQWYRKDSEKYKRSLLILIFFKQNKCNSIEIALDISYKIHSQYPDEALVQLWVHSLKVTKLDGLPQELLVEGQGETSINVVPVENSQTHNPPNKVEVRQVVLKKQQRAWEEV